MEGWRVSLTGGGGLVPRAPKRLWICSRYFCSAWSKAVVGEGGRDFKYSSSSPGCLMVVLVLGGLGLAGEKIARVLG